jgi:ATP-dependent DNA helicase RecQ
VPAASPLDDALHRLGYDAFRLGQREAIETLLETKRLLLVAPTGGGKSLTYQLPSLLLSGTTVVVSPLIALMADQVRALQARGVEATYLASTLDPDEGRRRFAALAQGRMRIAYVAPERLAMSGFRRMLAEIACPLLAIDEAHCISEWGHDFRPEYLQLGSLIADLKPARVLACTATATPIVRDEILARLGLPPDTPQHVHGFARPNLALRAVEIASGKDADRLVDDALVETIGFPDAAGRGAAIVYAPTRRRADEEAQRLRARGGRVGVYHAGLMPEARSRAQEAFSAGELDVVVATNAFGMGIDRADVRLVAHLAPPSSIEAYYQEVGRAGRDGKDAVGLLLVSAQDLPLRRRLIERGQGDGFAPPPKGVVEHKWQLFLELMRFVEGGSCRHDAILRYFGDEREALQGCGRCDVCLSLEREPEDSAEDRALIVRKALSGVARVHGRFGLTMAAKLLIGAHDERLARSGLDVVRTFGTLSDWREERVVRLLRRCVSAGFVSFEGDDRPVVVLTEDGLRAMKGLLPPLLAPRSRKRGARAAFAVPQAKGTRGAEPTVTHELDEALFTALRAHRLERARADGIPPYMVASDRTLRELCIARPRTRDELMAVYGIGEAKAERYGEGLLAVVATHLSG